MYIAVNKCVKFGAILKSPSSFSFIFHSNTENLTATLYTSNWPPVIILCIKHNITAEDMATISLGIRKVQRFLYVLMEIIFQTRILLILPMQNTTAFLLPSVRRNFYERIILYMWPTYSLSWPLQSAVQKRRNKKSKTPANNKVAETKKHNTEF